MKTAENLRPGNRKPWNAFTFQGKFHGRRGLLGSCVHTIFFHPDYTVGFGITPNHALRLVGCTTGRESHPALKNSYFFYKFMICTLWCFVKVFLIIKNNIVKEIIFLALYVVWLFVSVVIILAACTISIVSAIPAAVISITSVSLVGNTVFAAVF